MTVKNYKWHIERNISLGVIITLIGWAAIGVWFASYFSNEMVHVKEDQADIKNDLRAITIDVSAMKDYLMRQHAGIQ